MKKIIALLIVAVLAAYLLFWPVPIEPVAWDAPRAPALAYIELCTENLAQVVDQAGLELASNYVQIGTSGSPERRVALLRPRVSAFFFTGAATTGALPVQLSNRLLDQSFWRTRMAQPAFLQTKYHLPLHSTDALTCGLKSGFSLRCCSKISLSRSATVSVLLR